MTWTSCIPLYLALVALFMTSGCDSNMLSPIADDDSREASIAEARMSLDKTDYDGAIAEVKGLYSPTRPDPDVCAVLASAHMGKAGLDLTYLIENIGEKDSGSHFDVIASALSLRVEQVGGARFVSTADIRDRVLPELEQAMDILTALVSHNTDYDYTVQRGMAAALHFVAAIGSLAEKATGAPPGLEGLAPVNEEAFRMFFSDDATVDSRLERLRNTLENDTATLETLRDDLAFVNDAVMDLVANIGPGEDITEEVNGFLRDILGLQGSGAINEQELRSAFTPQRLSDFIQDMLR